MASAPILELQEVDFSWAGRAPFRLAVPRLAISPGEAVLLVGPSGSGKTTLLSLICGTVLAKTGSVRVAGTDMATVAAGRRDQFRAEHIGMIFQQFNLLPFATVADNILLPLRFAPARRARVGDPRGQIAALCAELGLPNALLRAKAETLSVGQQQRVAVARALIGLPPIVVADEPTSALDEGSQAVFLDLLFKQIRSHETTLLMVSHDERLASAFDRTLRLTDIAHIERPAP